MLMPLKRALIPLLLVLIGTQPVHAEDLFCRTNPRVNGPCKWVKGHLRLDGLFYKMQLTPDMNANAGDVDYYVEAAPPEIAYKLLANKGVGFVGTFELCPLAKDPRATNRRPVPLACAQSAKDLTFLPATKDGRPESPCKLMSCRPEKKK